MYIKVDHPIRCCNWCSEEYKPKTSHQNFCSKKCYKKYGKKFLGHSEHGPRKPKIPRLPKPKHYSFYKKDKCEFCGFVPVHKCQLDVDHIDGNHNNNEPTNLQTLCANCHRLKTLLNKEGWYMDK